MSTIRIIVEGRRTVEKLQLVMAITSLLSARGKSVHLAPEGRDRVPTAADVIIVEKDKEVR